MHASLWKVIPCLIVAGSICAASAQPTAESYALSGTLVLTNLRTAPFPHPKRAEGHTYREQVFPAREHYSDNTTAIFIPRQFKPAEKLDFVVHFHGWRNQVDRVLRDYKLIDQLVASRRNAILVVPQGPRNAPDSFGGKLEDPGGFAAFMSDVIATLREQPQMQGKTISVGRVVLSGHSGGYQVISSIVDCGGLTDKIAEVWLFDALYAQGEKFLAWQEKTHGRLLNIHTPGGGTREPTQKLIAGLKARNVPFVSGTEPELNNDQLRTNRIVFLATDLAHNDVVEKRRTFQRFLETSCLP